MLDVGRRRLPGIDGSYRTGGAPVPVLIVI